MTNYLMHDAPLTGADGTIFWVFAAATFAMVAVSVAIAGREAIRMRSAVPLLVFASAALWLPNEPFIDALLGFQYASDAPATLFTLGGRELPVIVLGVGAMFFIFPWVIARLILAGTPTWKILAIAVVAGIIDWPLEWMAIAGNVFEYYGDNPSRIFGLPLTSMVQNCFLYLVMGSAIVLCLPYLKGWKALLFLPVIPGLYYAVVLVCTWPMYLALLGGWPTEVFLPLAVIAAAMNAYIPITVLRFTTDYVSTRRGDLAMTTASAVREPVAA